MIHSSNNTINHTTTTNESDNSMSTLVAIEQYMSIYGALILATLGIIGNILSIFIFLSPRYRRQSSHFYLLSLALSDLCFLIINLVEDTLRNHNQLYKSRINILDRSSPIICILVEYARNTTRLLSSWIIVSFTIERLLVVFYPLKRAVICRRKMARWVVFILFSLSFLINLNVPFHYGIINDYDDKDTICDIVPKYRKIYMKFAINTMIIVYLLPMCIIGIVNTLICCKLWRKNLLTETDEDEKILEKRRNSENARRSVHLSDFLSYLRSKSNSMKKTQRFKRQTQKSSNSDHASIGTVISTQLSTPQINNSLLKHKLNNQLISHSLSNSSTNHSKNIKASSTQVQTYIQSRTNRVTVTLLLVSCSFLLLNFPYCAVWIANYIHGFRNATLKSIKEITELFMLTNFSINFLLYCLSGSVFRDELMYLIRCQWKELYNRNEGRQKSYNIQAQESKMKLRSTKYAVRNSSRT